MGPVSNTFFALIVMCHPDFGATGFGSTPGCMGVQSKDSPFVERTLCEKSLKEGVEAFSTSDYASLLSDSRFHFMGVCHEGPADLDTADPSVGDELIKLYGPKNSGERAEGEKD